MFCPQCQSEFREGFATCADCGVPLVDALPEPKAELDDEATVTVLETGDPGELALAHSLLEAEGINAVFAGEGIQSLFGMGSLGAGFNIAVGPAHVRVLARDAERANEILAELKEHGSLPDGELDDEDDEDDYEDDEDGEGDPALDSEGTPEEPT
jgi:hypothetical protein